MEATGRDIWAELGGCPRSWREAADLYRRAGVRTLEGVVTKALGEPVNPRQAVRGDVVLLGGALGICRGENAEFFGGMRPMGEVDAAWPLSRRPASPE